MRYNFDVPEKEEQQPRAPSPATPKEEVQWLPLQNHPIFTTATATAASTGHPSAHRTARNLMAWDGASRLYFWDSVKKCLHRISIRLGEPDPTSVLADSPSKVLQADVQLNFVVDRISINRNGSALLLAGSDGLCIMYLYGRTSTTDNTIICRGQFLHIVHLPIGINSLFSKLISNLVAKGGLKHSTQMMQSVSLKAEQGHCPIQVLSDYLVKFDCLQFMTVSIGSQIYFNSNNVIRTLQVSWHPSSDTHLGILSSDSVFRIFDLSSDVGLPEQEYYLQPVDPGKSRNAASICPVDFSFGADHLWDRFSFSLYYVAQFNGIRFLFYSVMVQSTSFVQLFLLEEAVCVGIIVLRSLAYEKLKIPKNRTIRNATFPELAHQATEGGNLSMLKAHPYALFDASLSLQGPLRKVCNGGEEEFLAVRVAECEGRAVSFLYNLVSKDSILVTAWSGGQLQIDALADEIQPVWIVGSPPRVRVDSLDRILGLAMICESIPCELSVVKLDQPDQTFWLGHPPPLLRLAIIDLALPRNMESGSLISLFVDPLIPERIYSLHDGGIDSIVLHFLPFTSEATGKNETMRTPSVHPVLNSFGYSWIVAVTSSQECIVLEMKSLNLLIPVHVDIEKDISLEEPKQIDTPNVISKELLSGPKVVFIPQTSPNLRSVAADSIEGRSTLHQYFKLFHENYVEYAHKVYFELKHHGPHLKRIIDDQLARLGEAQQKLLKVEEKQPTLEERIHHANQMHSFLEERLQSLRNLPGAHKKPLSRAEREFKSELDRFRGVELDALRSSIETLNARSRRYVQSSKGSTSNQQRHISGRKNFVEDAQISQLKSAIAKLSLVNSENAKRVKVVESALKSQERTGD
ncbi:Nuclear pore complex protein NUP88 [Vitis vinifera]|uniref:Nuclear pore complex protein NUP88 n=1 Tax=Vitis vinifera TaxID=29760 RepID=A0A438HA96_VITVI|nr:Nuclear pore complex protein NUP88 [Vitis vinifera]